MILTLASRAGPCVHECRANCLAAQERYPSKMPRVSLTNSGRRSQETKGNRHETDARGRRAILPRLSASLQLLRPAMGRHMPPWRTLVWFKFIEMVLQTRPKAALSNVSSPGPRAASCHALVKPDGPPGVAS